MLTAVFQKSGDWWAAYVEEMPGVNTQGATLAEARENLKEALGMMAAVHREINDFTAKKICRDLEIGQP